MDTTYMIAMRQAKEDGERAAKIGYTFSCNPFKNTPFQTAWGKGYKSVRNKDDNKQQ